MRTLAVVRIVFFALLLAYALYAMPWSYVVLPKEGTSLALPLILSDMRALAMAVWLGVAWIGLDAYLSFRLLQRDRASAAASAAAAAASAPASKAAK